MSKLEPLPRSVLAHALKSGPHGAKSPHPLTISERRLAIVQATVRAGQSAALATSAAPLPGGALPAANRALFEGQRITVCIQPNSWLVCEPMAQEGVTAARLEAAFGTRASIVDQTYGKACIRVAGEKARELLAKGCRVDLHPRVFQPGHAAVTPVAHISCILVQIDNAPTFDLILPSTLAESFLEWLELSAAEFGFDVA